MNPQRVGYDDLPVKGTSGRKFVLRMSFAAYLAYEIETGEPVITAIARIDRGEATSAVDLARLVKAAGSIHQPDFTLQDAADVLDRDPLVLHRLLKISLPEAAPEGAPAKKAGRTRRAWWPSFWRRGGGLA